MGRRSTGKETTISGDLFSIALAADWLGGIVLTGSSETSTSTQTQTVLGPKKPHRA